MALPNFLVCGVSKSGTTSLYYYLKDHPEIFMAKHKEIHFFSKKYEKGIEWYKKHFPSNKIKKIAGEISPSYVIDPKSPRRIKKHIPNVKLIFLLRNPVERAYSHYWFYLKNDGIATDRSFSEVIHDPNSSEYYLIQGYYYKHIKRFLSYFDKNQMYFIISEELKNNTLGILRECCKFLGVKTNYSFKIERMYKVTRYPSSPLLLRQLSKIWNFFRKKDIFFTKGQLQIFRGHLKNYLINNPGKPPMKQKDRQYLQEIYREPNRQLAEFLGKDLSFWQEKK